MEGGINRFWWVYERRKVVLGLVYICEAPVTKVSYTQDLSIPYDGQSAWAFWSAPFVFEEFEGD